MNRLITNFYYQTVGKDIKKNAISGQKMAD